jgi:hypothetical protein
MQKGVIVSNPLTLVESLDHSLANVKVSAIDQAAVTLAYEYARQLDRAQALAAEFDELDTSEVPQHATRLWRRIERLEAKVAVTESLAQLGPKFKDVLIQLGMTPAARGKEEPENDNDPVAEAVAALRADAAAIVHATTARANA